MGSADGGVGHNVDRVGTLAGTLCAIHCAACALLPAFLVSLGLGALIAHEVEWGLTIFAILLGLAAASLGWQKHGSRLAVCLLLAGCLGLLASRGVEMAGGDHHHHEHGDAHGEHGDEHGEHGDEHAEHGDEHADEHAEHGDEHAEHGDDHDEENLHGVGALIGVLSGLTLAAGHVVNLRAAKA